jgi:uncharacterized protein YdgA (DUF945 family)
LKTLPVEYAVMKASPALLKAMFCANCANVTATADVGGAKLTLYTELELIDNTQQL